MPSFVFQQSSVIGAGAPTFSLNEISFADHNELLLVATEPTMTSLFVDLMADLQQTTTHIETVKSEVRVRHQRRAVSASNLELATSSSTTAAATTAGRPRKKTATTERKIKAESGKQAHHDVVVKKTQAEDGAKALTKIVKSERPSASTSRRKKDEDALDCIYAELQTSVGMCRYWGKKCWNLRVPKAKGGSHSLCHAHRVKANDNQRRFDYKRRGTLWRPFTPDPNYVDISLFPGSITQAHLSAEAAAAAFEPFERPEPLQDKDFELLHELIGSAFV